MMKVLLNKKWCVLVFFISILFNQQLYSIEIKGYVKDKSGAPISYATVMVLQLPDSAFIAGEITNDEGYFLIKDKESGSNMILQISCVGYLSYSSAITFPYEGNIILEESTEMIDEITISAQKRIIKPSKGGFIANIENSVLSELGNVKDVLGQLPFILEINDQISILGKGEALIYINNRKINNESELSSLKSYEIKNIEVIMSPGVEYEASANSVIKITTLKNKENGIGGNITSAISFKERLSEFGDLALKYNKDQIEVFTEFQVNDNRKDYKRIYEYDIYTNDVKFFETRNEGKVKENMLKTYFLLGMNWDIDKNNSLGIKYTFDKKPHNDIYQTSQINTSFSGDNNKETFFSDYQHLDNTIHNYLNVYYGGKIRATNLLLDVDYSKGESTSDILSDELFTYNQEKKVSYTLGDDYRLFALKIILTTPLWKGFVNYGGEYSHTQRENYSLMHTIEYEKELPSLDNKMTQQFAAGFLDYNLKIHDLSVKAGLRFEEVDFNYYMNGEKMQNQSKGYQNLLPQLLINYEVNQGQLELAFTKYLSRPSYEMLSSNVNYITNYTRWGGNPFLIPASKSEVSFTFSRRTFYFTSSYIRNKNQIFEINELYGNNEVTVLTKPINLPDYNSFFIASSYEYSKSLWTTTIDGGIQFQDLKYGLPEKKYNKPFGQIGISNRFRFVKNYIGLLSFQYRSKGHYATGYTEGFYNLSAGLQKSFLNDKLLVKVNATDILNKGREAIRLYTNGIDNMDRSKGNTRMVKVTFSYNFNKTKSRYKGEGAANDERKRLL